MLWLPVPGMETPVAVAVAVAVTLSSRTTALLLPCIGITRSGLPSPLKSATAMLLHAVLPVELDTAAWKVPLPFPRNLSTVPVVVSQVARSRLPSPLKSAVAMVF